MRALLIILLLLFSVNAFSQSDFIKSIFYNIPFDAGIDSTKSFLSKDKRFGNVDSVARQVPHKLIRFPVFIKNAVPNGATEIQYRKNSFKTTVDSVVQNECLSYSSSIEFYYGVRTRNYLHDIKAIPAYLKQEMQSVKFISLINIQGELSGYEFYLSANTYCNVVAVRWEDECGMRYIEINYH